MTSQIHIATSFLPLYFGGAAVLLHTAGRIAGKRIIRNSSYWLFLATSLSTTFTCGFGGASIRKVESVPGIDLLILKTHAWTAMTVFLISVILAYFSWKSIRDKQENDRADKNLLSVSLLFLVVFVLTTFIAYRIR